MDPVAAAAPGAYSAGVARLAEAQQQRLDGARQILETSGRLGVLTDSMTRSDAVDVAWLATDPVLFDRLVRSLT